MGYRNICSLLELLSTGHFFARFSIWHLKGSFYQHLKRYWAAGNVFCKVTLIIKKMAWGESIRAILHANLLNPPGLIFQYLCRHANRRYSLIAG
jgi:hypothetical protein